MHQYPKRHGPHPIWIFLSTFLFLDLPLPKYIWSVVKNTSKVERLACLVAIAAMAIFIFLVVYYTMQAKKTGPEVVDVGKQTNNFNE